LLEKAAKGGKGSFLKEILRHGKEVIRIEAEAVERLLYRI